MTLPYQIEASAWKKSYGKVFYNGQDYYITPAGSEAKLVINKSQLMDTKVDKHYVKGRKIK